MLQVPKGNSILFLHMLRQTETQIQLLTLSNMFFSPRSVLNTQRDWVLNCVTEQSPGIWTKNIGHFYPGGPGSAEEHKKLSMVNGHQWSPLYTPLGSLLQAQGVDFFIFFLLFFFFFSSRLFDRRLSSSKDCFTGQSPGMGHDGSHLYTGGPRMCRGEGQVQAGLLRRGLGVCCSGGGWGLQHCETPSYIHQRSSTRGWEAAGFGEWFCGLGQELAQG